MIINLQEFKNDFLNEVEKKFKEKHTLGKADLKNFIVNYTSAISQNLNDNVDFSNSKYCEIPVIKQRDIIYINTIGLMHYCIVLKTDNDNAYCAIISSKEKNSVFTIEKDRPFKGNLITNTIICIPLEHARKSFVRVFESQKEFYEIKSKLRNFYTKIFS